MIVKVCGLKYPDNIAAVVATGVDMTGFIFYDKSPRYCNPGPELAAINTPIKIGVFVNASFNDITSVAALCRLDMAQLHGDESPDFCRRLAASGLGIIKALPVAGPADIGRANDYAGAVRYILFDTRCEGYGGSGRSFNHSMLLRYEAPTPFLISGGLRPESLEGLREFARIAPASFAGVDLNSGFETSPGMKDAAALQAFVPAIKNKPLTATNHEQDR
jgi:phosphoribosylanthranilate isomerase